MSQQVLPPGVEDGEEAYLSPEMLRVFCGFQHSRGTGTQEKSIEKLLVMEKQRYQRVGECEDKVDVWHRQQFFRPRRQPSFAGVVEALWTIAIAARNGELTISCLMGSLWLWGALRLI